MRRQRHIDIAPKRKRSVTADIPAFGANPAGDAMQAVAMTLFRRFMRRRDRARPTDLGVMSSALDPDGSGSGPSGNVRVSEPHPDAPGGHE
ncbi:MAG: hypothetical protein JWP14_555 [Frankiales bacterium]|nr:hypothetical protein [Frankiales bacterium]